MPSLAHANAAPAVAGIARSIVPGRRSRSWAILDEVRAAVSNLIDNAVKYSGSAVNVIVEIRRWTISSFRLRVRDQGPGIPKMELKQIFKRFYRVPGPLATRVKGTGLGLYIVRSVAKRHGGRAWAESEGPGHGSTFVLQLPIVKMVKSSRLGGGR